MSKPDIIIHKIFNSFNYIIFGLELIMIEPDTSNSTSNRNSEIEQSMKEAMLDEKVDKIIEEFDRQEN